MRVSFGWCWPALLLAFSSQGIGDEVIPHRQDRPPGPPQTPVQALAKMQVHDGFKVELFASEPDLVNPVSMTFDSRGRVWVTESLEYPRFEPGVGKDRIKILEDTDGDGKADRFTIFADDLNIPSGIALGFGGVFVANAPDLLFLQDTDQDGKADRREVLLTGFGRTDTHELPNNLIWGPDGWLYGLNGVFNHCSITHQGTTHKFNCALWRYHPRTKKFELFAEGTSNPWGLDYDHHGNFFVSACVIDHLWYLTQSGYYHRQAGPYPPFTWKIESIVNHKHQKAAYCGLCFYDASVYPEPYRGKLFMGNIHGNCINSDQLRRAGASYFATPRPDFLTANDAWFMPVVQKVGPDGCLWILDWYDRYHCYQDARRDPAGIDRLKGRLYRITYKDTPMPASFDLAELTSEALLEKLRDDNVYYRRWARQLLVERGDQKETLERRVLDDREPLLARMEALWTLISLGPLDPSVHERLFASPEPDLRAWAVRAAAEHLPTSEQIRDLVCSASSDAHPDVRLQAAIAARKVAPERAHEVLLTVLSSADSDESGLTVRIVWQNLLPLLDDRSPEVVRALTEGNAIAHKPVRELLPRLFERLLASDDPALGQLLAIAVSVEADPHLRETGAQCLKMLLQAWVNGELSDSIVSELKGRFEKPIATLAAMPDDPREHAALGLAVLIDSQNRKAVVDNILDHTNDPPIRELLLRALITTDASARLDELVQRLRRSSGERDEFRLGILSALNRSRWNHLPRVLLAVFPEIATNIRPQVLDLLCSRSAWATELLAAVEDKKVDRNHLNGNQLRRLTSLADETMRQRIENLWGKIRTDRDPERDRADEAGTFRATRRLQARCGSFQ